jgi:phosphate starvation-inducible PhoH-like protein
MKVTNVLCMVSVIKSNFVCKTQFVSKYVLTHPKQLKFQSLIQNNNLPIVIASGPAGTGKTMIACNEAIRLLKESKINKIIITRPAINVEENIGFLPGTLEKKMMPYMLPIYDYFLDYYTMDNIDNLITNNKLEISPLAYMRGRTFKDCIIIADEMQNSSINQMKMLLSRIGSNSKLLITGDLEQSDITDNGFKHVLKLLEIKYPEKYKMFNDGFGTIDLDKSCILRHEIIEKIIDLYKF